MWIGKVSDRKVSRSLGVCPRLSVGCVSLADVDWEYILAEPHA